MSCAHEARDPLKVGTRLIVRVHLHGKGVRPHPDPEEPDLTPGTAWSSHLARRPQCFRCHGKTLREGLSNHLADMTAMGAHQADMTGP